MTRPVFVPDADLVARCRAVSRPGLYLLLPRANRVKSILPGFRGVTGQVLATPQLGAHFVQHELQVEAGGGTVEPLREDLEQFLFVLEGGIHLQFRKARYSMLPGGYAWLPPDETFSFENKAGEISRIVWLRRRYAALSGIPVPEPIIANERDMTPEPEDTYREQQLLPFGSQMAFDMAVNLLNFEPGVHFGFVESHIMEHGLYMLAGRGIYWLNGDYHEVQRDDFIYMTPYCPQFFYTTGWETSRYLIYKEVNRDYTADL